MLNETMHEANSGGETRKTLFNERQFSDFLRLEFKCDTVCQTFIYVPVSEDNEKKALSPK